MNSFMSAYNQGRRFENRKIKRILIRFFIDLEREHKTNINQFGESSKYKSVHFRLFEWKKYINNLLKGLEREK